MGSASAMSSINRVMDKHGDDLFKEHALGKPGTMWEYVGTEMSNNTYSINVVHVFKNVKTGERVYVTGEPIDIDDLADRFPDCEVGY